MAAGKREAEIVTRWDDFVLDRHTCVRIKISQRQELREGDDLPHSISVDPLHACP